MKVNAPILMQVYLQSAYASELVCTQVGTRESSELENTSDASTNSATSSMKMARFELANPFGCQIQQVCKLVLLERVPEICLAGWKSTRKLFRVER